MAGFHDWTIDGVHLCMTRLKLLEIEHDGRAAIPPLLADVAPLRERSGAELRALGRLGHPMRRRRGEPGFRRVSWDEALDATAAAIARAPVATARRSTSPAGASRTSRTTSPARRPGPWAWPASIRRRRVCHAPSTLGLKATIGVAASTCSLQDVIESDLVVLWGTNVANNQPVFTKYLYLAKSRGARVVVVNPYLEPGLERYWVPSSAESALFGTKLCDLHVPVRPGGDVALANAVLKRLIARDAVDRTFVDAHTEGWDEHGGGPRRHGPRRAARRRRSDPGPAGGVRRRVRAGQGGGARVEHGHHAAPRPPWTACGPS